MKHFLSLLAVCSLAAMASAHADVVIYRGIARTKGGLTTTDGRTNLQRLYFVVDYNTSTVRTVVYYKEAGHKLRYSTAVMPYGVATCAILKGKNATILSQATASTTDSATFDHVMTYLRGKDSTLRIKNELVVEVSRPRSLRGYGLLAKGTGAGGAGSFTESIIGLTYQPRLTTTANNAGRTLDQVISELETDLQNKGYDPAI